MTGTVYKILTTPELAALRDAGHTLGAPVDLQDGYVHLSTREQVRGTLRRHFSGREGLWLLALDAAALGPALRWEPSRGGALFPHLYAPLALAQVASVTAIACGADGVPEPGPAFPEGA